MQKLHIQLAITFVCGALVLAHLFLPDFRLDNMTVALVAIAAIPWLGSLFSSLEIPGVGRVTYTETERQLKEADVELKELVVSSESVSEKIKEGQNLVDEIFKLGYSAGGGRADIDNVQIVRDREGNILSVQYEETA
jgi:hypothetical protein